MELGSGVRAAQGNVFAAVQPSKSKRFNTEGTEITEQKS